MPVFIIIGASRSGTTSLYDWLTSHPDVSAATRKELHYFTDRNYHKGPRWYRSQFPLARPGRITGESTPQMLYHPLSPERAAADLPATTRFIASCAIPSIGRSPTTGRSDEPGVRARISRRRSHSKQNAYPAKMDDFRHGRLSRAHHKFSYMARGEYASQFGSLVPPRRPKPDHRLGK